MTPELEEYIERHISKEPDYLKEIDRATHLYHINGRMCSGHVQGRLLKMLTSMIKPKKVLELGTFTGYSALCVAEGLEGDAIIHTIEADEELEEEILRNFKNSPFGNKIILHLGDALEVMKTFKPESFDLAIIDADKREYPRYLGAIKDLLSPGGYIIADNTLWDGHVIEQNTKSTQTRGIKEFNLLAASTPGLEVAIIPFRDGISLIKKT